MTPELRRWYFGINADGLRKNTRLVRAAVRSCVTRTALEPICLYFGPPVPELGMLEGLGVTVVQHRPSLEAALRHGYGEAFETFVGHWLRLDIPLIETRDDVVLYTDFDVLFRGQPAELERPRYLAIAPESRRYDWGNFNSGVMLMNVPALRGCHDAFLAAVEARLTGRFSYPTHDQRSYNDFFRGRTDRLPLEMNWKPYWGESEAASIVHFHGLKPRAAELLLKGERVDLDPRLLRDMRAAPEAYARYVREWALYARDGALPDPDRSHCRIVPRVTPPVWTETKRRTLEAAYRAASFAARGDLAAFVMRPPRVPG